MHAQIFGILTNTIPENQQKAFTERFMNDKSLIQPTMYFRFYLTQACLKKAGLADHYLETLGLWTEMLEKGLDHLCRKSRSFPFRLSCLECHVRIMICWPL